jgi:cellulose synthase/poly-beta-1,6-N-acetylglucosamine synthase-like glycosyltransferase
MRSVAIDSPHLRGYRAGVSSALRHLTDALLERSTIVTPPRYLHAAVQISVIVCAHNEERFIAACIHSLLAQTRRPDEILVIDNASDDRTGQVARLLRGVRVIDEPRKGLVVARERGRQEAIGDLLTGGGGC